MLLSSKRQLRAITTTKPTPKHMREENDRDLNLHVLSSHIPQRRQEQGAAHLLKDGDNNKALWSLHFTVIRLCFHFYTSCRPALKSCYQYKEDS